MGERTKSQPVDQFAAIVFLQDFLQRLIIGTRLFNAICHSDEMQIMIAEHGHRGITELSYKAQSLAGFGAAINQVACDPQAIPIRVKRNFVEQATERVVATLQIAYRVLSQVPASAERRERRV